MGENSTILTIGSCFARNIERYLARLGFDIPTLDYVSPSEESDSPNGILNKYTPPSIFQELDWAVETMGDGGVTAGNTDRFLHPLPDGRVIDTNLSSRLPVSRERFYERRQQIADVMARLPEVDCVVITLGYVEAWYDTATGYYLQSAPLRRHFPDSERYEFRILDFAESLEQTRKALDTVRRVNPGVRFLITTSPVPLASTFGENDVIIQNNYSKSVLRAVCGDLYYSHADVDYFPSYEIVTMTKSWDIWAADRTHVSEDTIGRIVDILVENYCPPVEEGRAAFNRSYQASVRREWSEAVELARQAVAVDPENTLYRAHLAQMLIESGDVASGLEEADAAVRAAPDSAFANFVHARALLQSDRAAEALEASSRCLAAAASAESIEHRSLNAVQVKAQHARIAVQAGAFHVAEAVWTEHIRTARRRREIGYVQLHNVLVAAGETERAAGILAEGLKRFPDHPGLRKLQQTPAGDA